MRKGSAFFRLVATCALALVAAQLLACGGTLPPPERRVIESDLDGWHFRRYQRTVDVEVYVAKNPAVAHTASYARVDAEKSGRLQEGDVASVFVTEYERDENVGGSLVRFARRLAQEAGYVVEETELGGQRVFRVIGHGEAWAFWSSGRFVVKVGGRGLDKIPSGIVTEYGRRYPSRVKDGALEEPLDEVEVEGVPAEKDKKASKSKAGAATKDSNDSNDNEASPEDSEE